MDHPRVRGDGVAVYYLLACTITWSLAAPAALAFVRRETPAGLALAGAGLSAFGPLIAALIVAAPRGELRQVFGRWRTPPIWLAIGLLAPLACHVVAVGLSRALGGEVDSWLHLPTKPEHIAALVVFSLGEEFGWRGFAQPRLVARYGVLGGSLAVGAMWGFWHLFYCFTAEKAGFDGAVFLLMLVELPLWAVIIGWALEHTRGSLAVALAFHAGGHLDNLQRASVGRNLAIVLHVAVLALAAGLVARDLLRSQQRQRLSASGLR